ncbi:MAG: hypothetical protein R2728_15490 [Chitinophagales bacterium]
MSTQNPYRSVEGHIVISSTYCGETVLAESHQLNLFLDYSSKKFSGKLDLKTLDTGIDSLNILLDSLMTKQILFYGFIPDDDFIDWEHLVREFAIPVTLEINGERLIQTLNIALNHFNNSNNFACLLSGVMELDISNMENQIKGLDNKIEVNFTQVLMRKDKH